MFERCIAEVTGAARSRSSVEVAGASKPL